MSTKRQCDVCSNEALDVRGEAEYTPGAGATPSGWSTVQFASVCVHESKRYLHHRTYDVCGDCLDRLEAPVGDRRIKPEPPSYLVSPMPLAMAVPR